jgi:hypothetical protein
MAQPQGSPEVQRHMRVKVCLAIIPLFFSLVAFYLQGCSVSEDTETPSGVSASPRLSLVTEDGTTSLVADGASSVPVQLTVTNASGQGMANAEVVFTTTAGTLSAPAVAAARRPGFLAPQQEDDNLTLTTTTDGSGVARAILTSSTTIETATVRAEALGFSVGLNIEFVGGAPARVQLIASPVAVEVGDDAAIQVTVSDANGNPVAGAILTFSLPTNVSEATLSNTRATTDANGRAVITYTAGVTPGMDTVRAVTQNNVEGTVTVTVNPSTTAGATTITLVAGSTTLVADGSSATTLRATVTDADGGGVAGLTVTFTTTAGTVSATTAVTNPNGVAVVNLIAPTRIGSATARATAEGLNAAVTVNFIPGAPELIGLTATPPALNSGETSTVQVTVADINSNPTPGITLLFSVSPNASGATLDNSSGLSDANGRATIIYTAGPTPGIDTVRAEATNGAIGTVPITVQAVAVASDLELLVSSPQLDSDGSETVTLSALVRDANNNFVEGVNVNFAADSGGILVVQRTTDPSGTALAQLETAGDPSNRVITVTATTGTLTSTNLVNVTGTTVTISGASTLVLGQRIILSLLLRDSGGNGIADETIALSSALGNTLSADTVDTDFNGQATVEVTAAVGGVDTIEATALGAIGTITLTVSSANFVFTAPDAGSRVNLGANQVVTVHWDEAGVNQVGQTINFLATRGTLNPVSDVTDNNGDAQVMISSTNAGPAIITASTTVADGPSTQIEISFVATTPASLLLQASPTTLGVNQPGSAAERSIITAVVRDAAGNLVENRNVSFTLVDVTGGTIFPSSAITDSFGRASTVYTAGTTQSGQDGVIIDAQVAGTTGCVPTDPIPAGPCDRVTLTVGGQNLFVILGTSNIVQSLGTTQYAKPYSVLVTDSNGNPQENATVELNIFPIRYQKGFYTLFFDEEDNCTGWGKVLTVTSSSALPNPDNVDQACDNEDVNRNGVLNPGEDINNNGSLQPGNVATTVPAQVTTDTTGFALFDVVYAREFTWVEIELEARATVTGSEAFSRARFFLPGVVNDFNDCEVAPPGQRSPYGLATTCGCDELTAPPGACPVLASLSPVAVAPGTTTISASGGTAGPFSATGGTETSYRVTTTTGTLTNLATNATGTAISVTFGSTFQLDVGANTSGSPVTITITVRDEVTGLSGTASVTQLAPVTLQPASAALDRAGGTITFSVSGGSQTSYNIATTFGALSATTVNFGQTFILDVPTNGTGLARNITVTATDTDTGDSGTAIVTQAP